LPRFGRASFRDWAGNPEWQEAVDAARENAAIKRDLEQRQRGKIMFRWALDMLNHLTKDHQRAVDEQRPEDACRLEDRICKLNKLLAEEETRLAQNEKQDNDEKSSVTLIFEGPEDGTVPPDES
ncbi:MAG: hypothetical protein HQ592_03935, partial [Planctomycetes bacterium]|nr:hypothetical protein [Planctomycetota bacterium]